MSSRWKFSTRSELSNFEIGCGVTGSEILGTSPAKGLKNKGFLGPCPLDRDVAALYGVETRIINQAVKNNPGKFPAGYVVELTQEEIKVLRSKILTLETNPG